MDGKKIMQFGKIEELQKYLTNDLDDLKKKSEELSKFIGEKLRSEEQNNLEDLAALKEMLDGPADPKNKDPKKKDVKKKDPKKKDTNSNWHSMESISIYDGVGLKGELELHFNALEVIKSEIDKIQKVKESVDSLVSKGLKKSLSCTAWMSNELPFNIAFANSAPNKPKFSYKSIFNVETEPLYEIKI